MTTEVLTKADKIKSLGLVAVDILEFLKYVKIQEPGSLAVPYEIWGHLQDFFRHLQVDRLIDVLKSKQIGISWALAAYVLWKIYTVPGWNVLMFSKGMFEAKSLLDKVRVIYYNLPGWMQVYTVFPNSTEQFGFKEMRSVITAYPSTETAGIGETAGTVVHDESDFHEFYEVNLSHTMATVADSPERQLISVSTVDVTKPDSYFKRHYRDAMEGKNGFKALFYGYDVRPGRDQEWYDRLVKANEETPWVVWGNYPRTWEEALKPMTAVSCFKEDVLQSLWDSRMEKCETRQGFIYILYPPAVGTQYVGGVDVGEGVGLDWSVLSIVGKRGLSAEVAAVIYTNKVGTDSFALEVDRLCREYRVEHLVVDNIGIGRAVIDKLVELGTPGLYMMNEKKYGYALTKPNKRELAVKTVEKVNNGTLVTRFPAQLKEMMEYQWVNGYPEPMGKTHGDTVISLMLAQMVLDRLGPAVEASMYVKGRRVF